MKTFILSMLFFLTVFLINTAIAQQSSDNSLRAPFISNLNSQQNIQSIMQNSEKDIVFIENLGQIRDTKGNRRPDVLFLTRSQGVDMYITNSGITYVFRISEGDINDKDRQADMKSSYYRLDMEFVGMNKNISLTKELAVEQKFNYFTPEYPNGISLKGYKKITIKNLYECIDLVYYEKEGKVKYDFIVKAGADPNKIKMKYKGANNVYIDIGGSVVITTPMGEIREEKPYTYLRNSGIEVKSRFNLNADVISFDVAEYDRNDVIVIDPTRLWATYYGGNNQDYGLSICTDNYGNVYITGWTSSTNFPIKVLITGAYNQTTYGGENRDAFILKFSSSGVRIWATYYGGNDTDEGNCICTDNSNSIYITGKTKSNNFPTKTVSGGHNQTTLGGEHDAFIMRFNSNGVRIWATYYGGSEDDIGWSICTDNSGNIYIAGATASNNFPLKRLVGAYNQYDAGGTDGFILKFNSNCARLWATYYGGSFGDYFNEIRIDGFGNLYITGCTASTDFPKQLLPGAYNQTSFGGVVDIVILKFNSSSCARLWATYYGAVDKEEGWGMCTDNSGNLYITGYTRSNNFSLQTLPGAYNQTTFGGVTYYGDAYILKFNSNNARVWSTYYGGDSSDYANGIWADNAGNLIVTEATLSTNFPLQTLQNAYNQTNFGGWVDIFILKFNSSGVRTWATYYGGTSAEQGKSVCTNNIDNLYVTGYTGSGNFPLQSMPGAFLQATKAGYSDVYVLKFSCVPLPYIPVPAFPPNGATLVVTNPLLDWDSVISAETYRVQVSTDSLFRTTDYDSSNITISEFQVPNNGLNTNTTYYWRVNATNAGGTSPFSTVFHFTTITINVSGNNNEIPKEFKLYNNYPNPFNPSTKIKFDIPKLAFVKIVVFNILGKELTTLANEKLTAGSYEVEWSGIGYASGVYFYHLITEKNIATKRMVLVK